MQKPHKPHKPKHRPEPRPPVAAVAATLAKPQYLAARDEWDNRFSDQAKGKRNWQIAALAFSLIALLLAGTTAYLATRSEIQVALIKENELGELAAWGTPDGFIAPSHRQYVATLSTFIRAARSISSDPNAQKQWVDQTYACATQAAATYLNAYYAENNPYDIGRRRTVSVTVRSITPISEATWQIRWLEETQDARGTSQRSEPWQAIVTTKLIPPRSIETVLLNPSNIYLTQIHWTPEAGDPS